MSPASQLSKSSTPSSAASPTIRSWPGLTPLPAVVDDGALAVEPCGEGAAAHPLLCLEHDDPRELTVWRPSIRDRPGIGYRPGNPLRYGKGVPRISSKHQVTLPVDALARAGLRAGDEVSIEADGEARIVVRRAARDIEQALGAFDGLYEPGYLERLRAAERA